MKKVSIVFHQTGTELFKNQAVELMTVQQLSQWKGGRAFQEDLTSSDVIRPAE